MTQATTKNEDTTVKLSKKAMNNLADEANPFESKKDCLERIIMQNCSSSNKNKRSEEESDLEFNAVDNEEIPKENLEE